MKNVFNRRNTFPPSSSLGGNGAVVVVLRKKKRRQLSNPFKWQLFSIELKFKISGGT